MTEYIAHRVNTQKNLMSLSTEYGVEIDLRDNVDGSLYLEHDPFKIGESFMEYLENYHHSTMILNIKSERIEYKILDLLKQRDINKYFFLDSSFPMIKALSDLGEKNIALRFSEYEGMDTIRVMSGKVSWVWVDCFTRLPLDRENYKELKDLGYNICIVSPELQGQEEKLPIYAEYLKNKYILPDAICTKQYNIEAWRKYF